MKKKELSVPWGSILKKTLTIMKITTILFMCCALNVYAGVFSQNARISVNIQNGGLVELFNVIEQNSDYKIFYKTKLINENQKLTLVAQEKTIQELLAEVLSENNLTYDLVDKVIVITPMEKLLQKIKISGTIKDATTGEPVAGANIIIEGSTAGTVSDADGKFSIDVTSGTTLIVSFLGYNTERIVTGEVTEIIVNLVPDIKSLEEVVVVGYGTTKKRDVIGSVSQVSGEDVQLVSTTTFSAALQGRAAGVNIRETSGTPGAPISIQVRGVGSINSATDPLWIIDGMPVYSGDGLGKSSGTVSQNPMSTINPNDIQSIEVLKDAAATAIYGSRGSNGVIIVTTKSGAKGKGKGTVTFDYSTGVSDLTKSPESFGFANTTEFFEILDIAKKNGGRGVFEPGDILNANFPTSISRDDALKVNTNWFDYVLRKGSFKDANFSYTQGLEKGSVFASFGYRNDKAVNVGNDFDRLTGRINLDLEPVKNFKTGAKLSLMHTNNYRNKTENANPGISTGNVGGFGSAIMGALPWYPVYDENNPSGYWNPGAGNLGVISRRDLMLDNKKTYRGLGTLYVEYDIPWVKGLSVRSEGSTDIIIDNSTNWISGTVLNSGKTYVYEGSISRISYNYNAYLKYIAEIGKIHSFNVVAGTESQNTSQYTREIEGRDPVGYNQEMGSTSPGIKDNIAGYLGSERYIRSFFGRANYKLMDKYMVGISMRRDGSSAFSSDVRWGNFVAFSAGWVISDENFFTPLRKYFSLFKLRGSFGQTGNESIPNNRNINTITNSAGNRYGTTEIMPAGTSITVGNRDITWEKTDSYDAGVDFGLFDNRISGSVAFYNKNVSDMLLLVSTPPSAAIGSVYQNVGNMKNWGWEFNISSVNMNMGDFKWNTTFNFTTNHNKILSLTPEMERLKGSTLFVDGRLGLFKMCEYAGIDPERGVHMIWEIDRTVYDETGEFVKTGRKIPFTDTNSGLHEMVLNDKSSIPTFYGGFDNTFSFKGIELGVFFTFSGGNYVYNSREKEWTAVSNGYWVKKKDLLTGSWTTPGQTDARYPLLFMEGFAPATTKWDVNATDPNTGLKGWWANPDINNIVVTTKETYDKNGGKQLTKYLEKADYLRLKSITLGYNIPKSFSRKLYMENLKIFGSATNLWTKTKYTGFDPETAANPSILPSVKTFSIGASVTF